MASAKVREEFKRACINHANLNPACVPPENTVQNVALRLKEAHFSVYAGPNAVFRQWAAHLLKEPSSQLDRLIQESDPPPNVRLRLSAVPSPQAAANEGSIKLAKIALKTMRTQHDDLRAFAANLVQGAMVLHGQAQAILSRLDAGEGQLFAFEQMLGAIQNPTRPAEADQHLVDTMPDAADTCRGAQRLPHTPAGRAGRTASHPTPTPTPPTQLSSASNKDGDSEWELEGDEGSLALRLGSDDDDRKNDDGQQGDADDDLDARLANLLRDD